MEIKEIGRNVAPTSTAAGAAILNAIEARAVEMMVADGYVPEVFSSSNVDGGDAINDAYVKKYIKEIKALLFILPSKKRKSRNGLILHL